MSDLIGINPDNYFRTADQVVENLEQAFRTHQKAIAEARLKKLKLFGIDVTQCVATGGLAVAATLTGSVALRVVSGISRGAGFTNLKDIKTKFTNIVAEVGPESSLPLDSCSAMSVDRTRHLVHVLKPDGETIFLRLASKRLQSFGRVKMAAMVESSRS